MIPIFFPIWCIFFWVFVVPSVLTAGTLIVLEYGIRTLVQKYLLTQTFRGRICEINISEYDYRRLCRKVETCGYNVEAMRDGLEQAAINGQFISEYNNGLVVFKPDSVWKVKRNRITGLHYQSARAGLRIVGKRIGFANNNVQIIKLEGSICFSLL